MSEQERIAIMESFNTLPEDKKKFLLGYAAGVASAYANDKQDEPDKTDKDK